MQRFRIPNTDLDVSALSFGMGSFGTGVKGEDADRLLADYLEAGGNFLDTAHCYACWVPDGLGASEREMAASLRRLNAWDKVVVATKGGHPAFGDTYQRPDDYLAERVITADIDESLERLDTAQIDLYYLHRDDSRVPVGEIMEILDREIKRGRIRWLGASNWTKERIAEANAYATAHGLQGFVISQMQWSLAEPDWKPGPDPATRFITDEDAAWYATANLPIAAYSATANGYFAGRGHDGGTYVSPTNEGRYARAVALAEQLGCTPTQIALAYLLNQPARTIPLFGTNDRVHLAEALGAASIILSAEQVDTLHG